MPGLVSSSSRVPPGRLRHISAATGTASPGKPHTFSRQFSRCFPLSGAAQHGAVPRGVEHRSLIAMPQL